MKVPMLDSSTFLKDFGCFWPEMKCYLSMPFGGI